eukprot:3507578-Alexandrium_andersonii.AAC.1
MAQQMRRGSPRRLAQHARRLQGPISQCCSTLIPLLSTVAFDMLQGDLPLRFDVPQQGLSIMHQTQILVRVDLARGGLGGVDRVIADHRGSTSVFAIPPPEQCLADAAKFT